MQYPKFFFPLAALILLFSFQACRKCDNVGICNTGVQEMTSGAFEGSLDRLDGDGNVVATYSGTCSVSRNLDILEFSIIGDSASGLDSTFSDSYICNVMADQDCELSLAIVDYRSLGYFKSGTPAELSYHFEYNGTGWTFLGQK